MKARCDNPDDTDDTDDTDDADDSAAAPDDDPRSEVEAPSKAIVLPSRG